MRSSTKRTTLAVGLLSALLFAPPAAATGGDGPTGLDGEYFSSTDTFRLNWTFDRTIAGFEHFIVYVDGEAVEETTTDLEYVDDLTSAWSLGVPPMVVSTGDLELSRSYLVAAVVDGVEHRGEDLLVLHVRPPSLPPSSCSLINIVLYHPDTWPPPVGHNIHWECLPDVPPDDE